MGGRLETSTGTSTFGGFITLTADSTLAAVTGASLTLTGEVEENSSGQGLTITGGGIIVANCDFFYSGETLVAAGVFEVNEMLWGGTDTTVESGATLAGAGTIQGLVTVESGGTLSPGNSPGLLNVADLTFASGSTFVVELAGVAIAGIDYDQLASSGEVSLGDATLDLTVDFTPTPGDRFVILSKSGSEPVASRFLGLPDRDIFTAAGHAFQTFYEAGDGNDIELVAVDNSGRTISFTTESATVGESSGVRVITADLSVAAASDLNIPVAIGGSATTGADYTLYQSSFFFPAGATQAALVLEVRDDARFEGAETIELSLQAFGGIPVGASDRHTLNLSDNDPQPTVFLSPPTQQGNEGSSLAFAVLLTSESDLPVTVLLEFAGSADSGDFTLDGGASIVIPPGQRSAAVRLNVTNDTVGEASELIVVNLGVPTNALLPTTSGLPRTHVVTIPQNDEPTFSFDAASRLVDESVGSVSVVVRLSNLATSNVSIPLTVIASSGADFALVPAGLTEVTILAGQDTATIQVDVIDDPDIESGEFVVLQIGAPGDPRLGRTRSFTLQIRDNDTPRIELTGSAATIWENEGPVTVTGTLSFGSPQEIRVPIGLATGGGVRGQRYATLGQDFLFPATELVFAPFQTVATAQIAVVNDSLNEFPERVSIACAPSPVCWPAR